MGSEDKDEESIIHTKSKMPTERLEGFQRFSIANSAPEELSVKDLERILYRTPDGKCHLRLNDTYLKKLTINVEDIKGGWGTVGTKWLKKHQWDERERKNRSKYRKQAEREEKRKAKKIAKKKKKKTTSGHSALF